LNAGATDVWLTTVSYTFDTNTWYINEFRLYGSSLKIYINDVEQSSTTDSDLTSGYVGLETFVNSGFEWDWFLVRKYVDPEPGHGSWGVEEEEQAFVSAELISKFNSSSFLSKLFSLKFNYGKLGVLDPDIYWRNLPFKFHVRNPGSSTATFYIDTGPNLDTRIDTSKVGDRCLVYGKTLTLTMNGSLAYDFWESTLTTSWTPQPTQNIGAVVMTPISMHFAQKFYTSTVSNAGTFYTNVTPNYVHYYTQGSSCTLEIIAANTITPSSNYFLMDNSINIHVIEGEGTVSNTTLDLYGDTLSVFITTKGSFATSSMSVNKFGVFSTFPSTLEVLYEGDTYYTVPSYCLSLQEWDTSSTLDQFSFVVYKSNTLTPGTMEYGVAGIANFRGYGCGVYFLTDNSLTGMEFIANDFYKVERGVGPRLLNNFFIRHKEKYLQSGTVIDGDFAEIGDYFHYEEGGAGIRLGAFDGTLEWAFYTPKKIFTLYVPSKGLDANTFKFEGTLSWTSAYSQDDSSFWFLQAQGHNWLNDSSAIDMDRSALQSGPYHQHTTTPSSFWVYSGGSWGSYGNPAWVVGDKGYTSETTVGCGYWFRRTEEWQGSTFEVTDKYIGINTKKWGPSRATGTGTYVIPSSSKMKYNALFTWRGYIEDKETLDAMYGTYNISSAYIRWDNGLIDVASLPSNVTTSLTENYMDVGWNNGIKYIQSRTLLDTILWTISDISEYLEKMLRKIWNIKSFHIKVLNVVHSLRNAVQTSISSLYNSLVYQIKTFLLKHGIRSFVESLLNIKYLINEYLENLLEVLYGLSGSVISQLTSSYSIRSFIEKLQILVSSLREYIVKSYIILFSIRAKVEELLQLVYSLSSYLQGLLSVQWSSRMYKEKLLNIIHGLRSYLEKSLRILYEFITEVIKVLSTVFNISQYVSRSTSLKYLLKEVASKVLVLKYSLLGYLVKRISIMFRSLKYASKTLVSKHLLPVFLEKFTSFKYGTIGFVHRTIALIWTLRNYVSSSLRVEHLIRAFIAKVLLELYLIKSYLKKSLHTSFDLYTFLASTIGLKFNIKKFVGETLSLKHILKKYISAVLRLTEDLSGFISKVLDVRYVVRIFLEKLLIGTHLSRKYLSKSLEILYKFLGYISKYILLHYNTREFLEIVLGLYHILKEYISKYFRIS